MSQTAQILRYLKKGYTITPLEALSRFGCFRLGARIWDLRKAGHNIKSMTVHYGDKHFAKYKMVVLALFITTTSYSGELMLVGGEIDILSQLPQPEFISASIEGIKPDSYTVIIGEVKNNMTGEYITGAWVMDCFGGYTRTYNGSYTLMTPGWIGHCTLTVYCEGYELNMVTVYNDGDDMIVYPATVYLNPLDADKDGVYNLNDNCVSVPNGPLKGTCRYSKRMCHSQIDCGCHGGLCSMHQEDKDGDGLGDVCDKR